MLFRDKLKQARKEKNLTVPELSEKTGLSVITIYNYESGKTLPKVDNIGILAKVLNCDYEELYELVLGEINGTN